MKNKNLKKVYKQKEKQKTKTKKKKKGNKKRIWDRAYELAFLYYTFILYLYYTIVFLILCY